MEFNFDELCLRPWVLTSLTSLNGDRQFVFEAVKRQPKVFMYCEFKGDGLIALAAISRMPQLMPHVDDSLRTKEFEMDLVRINGDALNVCQFKDEELSFAAVQQNGHALRFCKPFQSNARIVRAAVEENGNAILHASQKMQEDDDIIACALKTSPEAVFLLPKQKQPQWVPIALSYRGWLLMEMPAAWKTLENVLCAVKNDGLAAPCAPMFRDNETVALAAVTQCGRALRFFSRRLQDDDEVVLAAIQQSGSAIQFSSARLLDALAEVAVAQFPYAFVHLSLKIRSNREFVLRVVSNMGHLIAYASAEMKADRELVMAAVQNNGNALQWAADTLKADFSVVHAAVVQNKEAFYHCHLKGDRALARLAVEYGPNFQMVSEELKNDPTMAVLSVANYTPAFYFASPALQNGGLFRYMRQQQDDHKAFMLFMAASCTKRHTLVCLNAHGKYFGWIFKKLIAAYCGVAVGKDYKNLCTAERTAATLPALF